jgi:hypothetical protein
MMIPAEVNLIPNKFGGLGDSTDFDQNLAPAFDPMSAQI